MAELPRSPEQPILPTRLFAYLVVIGFVMGVSALAVIWWATDAYGEVVGRTMGLTVFSLANVWFALETSDPEHSVFSIGTLAQNPSLLKGAGLALVATVLATELGLLNRILETVGLSIDQWLICIVVSLAVLVVVEVTKLLHLNADAAPRLEAAAA
jgi:Ca2+-transporting ATPase